MECTKKERRCPGAKGKRAPRRGARGGWCEQERGQLWYSSRYRGKEIASKMHENLGSRVKRALSPIPAHNLRPRMLSRPPKRVGNPTRRGAQKLGLPRATEAGKRPVATGTDIGWSERRGAPPARRTERRAGRGGAGRAGHGRLESHRNELRAAQGNSWQVQTRANDRVPLGIHLSSHL